VSIVLTRVDDRLIHGQVVVGWVPALQVRRIVLVSDDVRANPWEQELYVLGVPPELEVEFVSVAETLGAIHDWAEDNVRTLLLIGDVDTIVRLCDGTDVITRVNVGGIHESTGRDERLAYVYLSDEEATQLRQLHDGGVQVTAQDVPTAKALSVEHWT
jgi:PTS system mannose-specific IIB component/fructoselysine and glucoselysine-specific PTS system IIB component